MSGRGLPAAGDVGCCWVFRGWPSRLPLRRGAVGRWTYLSQRTLDSPTYSGVTKVLARDSFPSPVDSARDEMQPFQHHQEKPEQAVTLNINCCRPILSFREI
jgi:hypothetical protein